MRFTVPLELPLAGLLIDVVSGAVAIIAGLSGLLGGAAHYLAVLAGRAESEVEVSTGLGFFAGMTFGTGLLLLDAVV